MSNHQDHTSLIWQIADLLRGPYRPPQYERVMLPMTVLRRFDSVLSSTKEAVLQKYESLNGKYEGDALDSVLNKVSGQRFHNHSPLTFEKLKGAPDSIRKDLVSYINGFSGNVRRIFEYFEFEKEIELLDESNILYLVISKFSTINLHPDHVDNVDMGKIFEHLIRKFNELANETAGDHFTPREVIRLMVNLLFINDDKLLTVPGTVRRMLDPACGTGGMLAEAQGYLKEHHLEAKLYAYGQDYNKRAFATAASDMLIKEVAHNGLGENIKYGDSLIDDKFAGEHFDYLIANPPFGVDWKKQQKEITRENEKSGFTGRFGAGLPRVNDGALLFLQHMIAKFEPVDEKNKKFGSRLAIVFSGSPLFTGGAGSGESNIRRWIIENDWLEAVVALPEQMFYNTAIGTYIWVITNRKEKNRKGKIQLFDARDLYLSMDRSLGDKRREIGDGENGKPDQISEIVRAYGSLNDVYIVQSYDKNGKRLSVDIAPIKVNINNLAFNKSEVTQISKVFRNAEFGYTKVTIEQPLRLVFQFTAEGQQRFLDAYPQLLDDLQLIGAALGNSLIHDYNTVISKIGKVLLKNGIKWRAAEYKLFRQIFTYKSAEGAKVIGDKGNFEPDPDFRSVENIPLETDIEEFFISEVRPYLPDAWMDRSKDKVGYEINFNKYFYHYTPSRNLKEIDSELKAAESEILKLLRIVTE
jgi:type I restriction enzyme M protein